MRLNSMVLTAAALATILGCNDRNPDPDGGPPDGMDSGPDMCDGTEGTVACCSDGVDNDENGHIDCNDFACCDLVTCGPSTTCGMEGDGGPPAGDACDGPSEPEDTVAACSDECSNDHAMDLFVDCDDFDCCDVRTDCPPDTQCGMQPQACEGDPEPENTLPRCMDGCSNDHDDNTFVDCNDFDCCWLRHEAAARGLADACGAGTVCADDWDPPTDAELCAEDDLNDPPVRENSYERCSDECTTARDSRWQDCESRDCCLIREAAGDACPAGTYCADTFDPSMRADLCAGDDGSGDPPAEDTVELCSNDCDDDRDGFADCDDFDCCEARTDCPASTQCGMMASP